MSDDNLRVNLYSFIFAEEARVKNELDHTSDYLSCDRSDSMAAFEFLLAQKDN